MFVSTHYVGFGAGAGSLPETLSTMGETHTAFNTNSLQYYALKFTPTYGGTVTGAELGGCDSNNPAINWSAQIYTNSAGSPGSTVGSASNGASEAAHPSTHSFTWGSPPTVSAGTTYWIVFGRATSSSKMSICASTGIVTGGGSSPGGISDGSNLTASSDVRASLTITP